MTRTFILVLLCLGLYGCATPGLTNRQVNFGMTKEQVMWKVGSPLNWSCQTINNHTYETWSFWGDSRTYDFVDNVLVGYSERGRYYSKESIEDVRDYRNEPEK
jgi:hypothetical protein